MGILECEDEESGIGNDMSYLKVIAPFPLYNVYYIALKDKKAQKYIFDG